MHIARRGFSAGTVLAIYLLASGSSALGSSREDVQTTPQSRNLLDAWAGGNQTVTNYGNRAGAPRRRRIGKEQVMADIDINAAASAVDDILLPGSEQWDKLVARTILTKSQPQLPGSFPKAGMLTQGATARLKYLYPQSDVRKDYWSCAVVGNAGMLKANTFGQSIDAHDVVIRFNDGPTGRWTRYAGSRTTFRMINNYWSKKYKWTRPKDAFEENLMLFSFSTLRSLPAIYENVKRHNAFMQALLNMRFHSAKENVVFMAPELAMNARRSYGNTYDTLQQRGIIKVHGRNAAPTGIEGVFMAMQICRHVNLFGYDVNGVKGFPYHYFDSFKGTGSAHSFKFQSLFLKILEHKHKINICVPGHTNKWCNMHKCRECRSELH